MYDVADWFETRREWGDIRLSQCTGWSSHQIL